MASGKKASVRGGRREGAGRPRVLKDRARLMVHLEKDDLDSLQEIAEEEAKPVGQVIREILSRHLRRRGR